MWSATPLTWITSTASRAISFGRLMRLSGTFAVSQGYSRRRDAFTSIIEDEEEFRDQLRKFSEIKEDGQPVVRPIHAF